MLVLGVRYVGLVCKRVPGSTVEFWVTDMHPEVLGQQAPDYGS